MENNINELNNRNGELTVEKIREIIRNFFIFHNGREFDSSLLYRLENGAKLYDEICSDENYPYIGIEIDCLKELHSDPTFIKELKKVKNITDHRAGNGDKGVELLRETGWEGTYHATDCTQDMLKLAESRINRAIENVPGMERVKLGDFSKVNSKELLVKNLEDHMYLFLGGSICNMSDWEIQEELEKMGNNSFINGNRILLSYYTAPKSEEEIKELENIYNSQKNKVFHENAMEKLLGIESENNFEYYAEYKKDATCKKEGPFPGRIEGKIRFLNDTTIQGYPIKKGSEFTIHYSRRFTKEGIEALFKKSGCSITEFPTVDRDGVSMVLLKKKPAKRESVKKKYLKPTAISILITLLATAGGYKFYKDKNEKNKIENEIKTELATGKYETIDYSGDTQISKEFFVACGLDKLDSEDRKQVNIGINAYADGHEGDLISHEELISRYWRRCGPELMEKYGAKPPYNFITKQLINNTYYAEHGGYNIHTIRPNSKTFKLKRYDDPFKYNSSGKEYIILKVYIGNNDIPIYLATEIGSDFIPEGVQHLSTDCIKDIEDKNGLDNEVLQNNNNLNTNLVVLTDNEGFILNTEFRTAYPDGSGYVHDDSVFMYEDFEVDGSDLMFETHLIYLKGEKYYIRIGKTFSGKDIISASKSPDGPFSIATFNEISEDFVNAWSMWIKPGGDHKSFHGVTFD